MAHISGAVFGQIAIPTYKFPLKVRFRLVREGWGVVVSGLGYI